MQSYRLVDFTLCVHLIQLLHCAGSGSMATNVTPTNTFSRNDISLSSNETVCIEICFNNVSLCFSPKSPLQFFSSIYIFCQLSCLFVFFFYFTFLNCRLVMVFRGLQTPRIGVNVSNWCAASDTKSPFHSGSEARHRRIWKGLWKV